MTLSLAGTRLDAGVSVAEVNLKLIWGVVTQMNVGERGNPPYSPRFRFGGKCYRPPHQDRAQKRLSL
jgi:hypothetical protein